ncbi:MAG: NADH-dependent [FeFe] hydrogenase, group A6 [Firmicutes bacterium]|jgi:NADH-quinone oxidoreductase subunit G/NADP-reducing hydrogenase subunit HndD|nr:NADH-dependent [FeFe] hydrogenase, group A6 [Bacillota bacterium]MDH7494960.1 NADH-dependent [FeFe] hydrogenase, group A6 [Bacillota bacterium]
MAVLTIDGRKVEVDAGTSILDAAKKLGVDIPTLCHHPDLAVQAVCRICVVDIEGQKLLQPACAFPVQDGMVVYTNTPRVRQARKLNLELLLARHPQDCLQCVRNRNCELQALAERFGMREIRFERKLRGLPEDHSTPAIVREPDKCILCRRCVSMCHDVQAAGVLFPSRRGVDTQVTPVFARELDEVACALCGQCIHACPVGAIAERDDTERVWRALADPNKHVVVQTAPATRVSIGEEMGLPPGRIITGKLVAALRRLGFDRVMDTDFTADLTIIEEGNEFLKRLKEGGVLPLITSCSPGWIKFGEHFYPDLLKHVSTCKSPQQMFGALVKTYYARKAGIDPKDIFSVSLMPCTAKKYEADRPEMRDSGYKDVDVVLTSRELGRMLREAGIRFEDLPEEEHDDPMGISTGAAAIFGATGGVMEAALRTVYEVATGNELPRIDFEEVRGLEGIKEAQVKVGDLDVRVAVAHGLGNAKKILDLLRQGKANYHFIEIMCCPGGCVGGGGQPIPTTMETRLIRGNALYEADKGLPYRKSHENPAIKQIYAEFLGEPLGEVSHRLLHTHYTPRDKYPSVAGQACAEAAG